MNNENAMHGIRSISGPRNILNAWFVPRRPHPERSAKYAFFACLRSGGAPRKLLFIYYIYVYTHVLVPFLSSLTAT